MKKFKLLTPILGLTAVAGAIVPIASCSCKTSAISTDGGIEKAEHSDIKEKTDLTITVTYKTGYKFKAVKVTVDGKEVASDKITVSADGKTITVKGEAITSVNVKIELTSEQTSSQKIKVTYTRDPGKGDFAEWSSTNPAEIDASAKSITVSIKIIKTWTGDKLVYPINPEEGVKYISPTWLIQQGAGAVGDTLTHTFTWTGNPTKIEFWLGGE